MARSGGSRWDPKCVKYKQIVNQNETFFYCPSKNFDFMIQDLVKTVPFEGQISKCFQINQNRF